ncbi:GFA family protein [Croceicoccus ponticola]|uniref:GFA family protein n=1 Tax=Croceicoccus ponticola TaxID=2217664 RepID=A0A437GYS9_9SPHN|nr:GFA family protein [Croceicoccus ponticola]RVQ67837.1 GFA family protein [Croceicoccus ponticola]
MHNGGCHCGTIRYCVSGDLMHHALCHCEDCRRCAGATPVAWIAFKAEDLAVTHGTPKIYRSSPGVERHFCPECGTGLFYYNEPMLPGLVDIQSVTMDDAAALSPTAHIMMAEALPWEASLDTLPKFERFPGQD